MATEVKILLMGTTGQGKSATGNMLLSKQDFKAASTATSQTKEPSVSFAQFENKKLQVVDGPGLADTDMTVGQDREATTKNMSQALAMCYGSVDAFLFVTKYGSRFTLQDTAALEDIKKIFGDKFMEHMIVVVTNGDQFQDEMADSSVSFDDWCREQKGTFQKLYTECGGRFVLFNNKEKEEEKKNEQRRKVVEMVEGLTNQQGLYTSRCFQEAEFEREKMILKHKAPLLKKEFQEKICLLAADIDKYLRKPSESATMSIIVRVEALKEEIKKHDKGYGVLEELLKMVEQVESNLKDTEEFLRETKEIERNLKDKEELLRQAKETERNLKDKEELLRQAKETERNLRDKEKLLRQAMETERNLRDNKELFRLGKEMEEIRVKQAGWSFFGTMRTIGRGVGALVALPIVVAASGVGGLATGVKDMLFD